MLGIYTGLPNARDFHRIAKMKFENFDLGISTGLPISKVYSGLPITKVYSGLPNARDFHRIAKMKI